MRRKVLLDGQCEVCHTDVESSSHIFWDCAFVHEVWDVSKLFPSNSWVHFHSFMDMLWYGVMEADWEQTKIERIVMVAWTIWTNWNKIRVGGAKKSSQQVVYSALDFLAEFQEGVCAASVPSSSNQTL